MCRILMSCVFWCVYMLSNSDSDVIGVILLSREDTVGICDFTIELMLDCVMLIRLYLHKYSSRPIARWSDTMIPALSTTYFRIRYYFIWRGNTVQGGEYAQGGN